MDNLSSQLQVNCGLTSGELHLLQQGCTKLMTECGEHTAHLANVPNGSMDDNTAAILDYYSKRMQQIRAMQVRLNVLSEEMNRKKLSVAHNS